MNVNKVKSTYDHLCGLLVHSGGQRKGNEGNKNILVTVNKKGKESSYTDMVKTDR